MNILGIDPGKSGGFVILNSDGYLIDKTKTPSVDKEIDVGGLVEFLGKHKIDKCILEDVHSIFGSSAKSNFSFGRNLGLVEGLLYALKIPYQKVTPKVWQSYCFKGVKDIWKQGTSKKRRDTKKMALIAAKRLYPHVNLLATKRSKVPSDGIVDALLMAHWGRFC